MTMTFSSIGAASFALVIVYLISVGRIAVLMQRAGDEKASLSDPNGQFRVLKLVFTKNSLDPTFRQKYRVLLWVARLSGAICLLLFIVMFATSANQQFSG